MAKSVEKLGRQPLFVIDMKYSNFSQAMEFLVKDLQSNLIGLISRDYFKCVQSYETLTRYADQNVAFLALQVGRIDFGRYNISTMHYLPFLANDIYAVEIPSAFVPKHTGLHESVLHKLRNIRLFDKQSLQINEISSYEAFDEKICHDYDGDSIIREMLENYAEAETDDKKYVMLNAFSRIDELKSSLSEFDNLQKFIKQESAKDYLQEKTTLKKELQPMSHSTFDSW